MDFGTNSTDFDDEEDEIAVVQKLDNDVAYGYQCSKVVNDNTVTDIPLTFYLDLAFPKGTEGLAISYLQAQLVESVAAAYGISTGELCDDPRLDGSTWLVQFLSQTSDWTRQTLFQSCRELQFEADTEDCFVYEVIVTGSVLGGNMQDVLAYMENELRGTALTVNSPYSVGFLGVPVEDAQGGDSGRDNLDDASNVNSIQTGDTPTTEPEPQTFTVVGGLMVAALTCAFCGIMFLLWRRRRAWLRQRDDELELDLQKPHYGGTHPTDLDNHDERIQYDDEDSPYPNNVAVDMGTSFKDQLMGVHGSTGGRPPMSQQGYGGTSYAMGPVLGRTSPYPRGDAMSDSDADSWAQTDGTIGSLELQLEPITAEV